MTKKDETYELMIEKLEKIIKDMDNPEIELEESLKSYEEGVKLCNKLYKILNKAEGKIKVLRDGKDIEEDFIIEE